MKGREMGLLKKEEVLLENLYLKTLKAYRPVAQIYKKIFKLYFNCFSQV